MKTRSVFTIATIVCTLLPLGALAAETNAAPAGLPSGTSVNIRLLSKLSSSAARAGETFPFRVTADVRSADAVVVPAGAQGIGEVVSVESAGSMDQAGKLMLRFDYVVTGNGQKLITDQTLLVAEGKRHTGAANHKWSKGREASISPDAQLSIIIDRTVDVQTVNMLASFSAFGK